MKFLILILLSLSFHTLAGEKGNGGDAVVCRDANGEIISAELLDYYEGRVMRKMPTLEYPELSDEAFFTAIFNKLNPMEDLQYPYMVKEAMEIKTAIDEYLERGFSTNPEILFTEDTLTDLNDSGELIIKKGCAVEQLAIWSLQQFPEDPKFIFQAQLLKVLSPRDLRGIVLHEIIYKVLSLRAWASYWKLPDSIAARYLNQKILSRPLKDFKFWDYVLFVRNMYNWSSAAGIQKKYYFLRLSDVHPDETNGFIKMKVVGTQITVVLDLNGKLDRDLTLRYGSIWVEHYFNANYPYHMPGSVELNGFATDFRDLGYIQYLGLKFGKNKMVVRLNKLPSESPLPPSEWGIKYRVRAYNPPFKDLYITIKAAPKTQDQTLVKEFEVGLDEDMRIFVKDLN